MHWLALVQETPLRKSSTVDGSGEGTSDQAVPSHTSARVSPGIRSRAGTSSPTAMQKEDPVHETLIIRLLFVRLGLGSTDHEAPSHASANVNNFPALLVK